MKKKNNEINNSDWCLTVAANEKNNKVDASQNSKGRDASVRFDAVVHDHVPIFTGQYLFCGYEWDMEEENDWE